MNIQLLLEQQQRRHEEQFQNLLAQQKQDRLVLLQFLTLTVLVVSRFVAEAGHVCVCDEECVAMSYTDNSPFENVNGDDGAKCGDGLWRFETHKSCQLSCTTDQFCADKLGPCPPGVPGCTHKCVQGRS